MHQLVEKRLSRFINAGTERLLRQGRVGIERESLRVGCEGTIAQTPHPQALGSALKNPYVTTDYSEALIELVTPPFVDKRETLDFLGDLLRFVYSHLDGELLWATSMPCVVAGEASIPIAGYGSSNAGMMKTVYRRGLGHRYGRIMQVIAGVHFNYSFSDDFWRVYQEQEQDRRPAREFIADRYFGVLRNLQRVGWLIPYLFGASPAVCKSFLDGKETRLAEFDSGTYYGPYATSLRMGDIGYQNNKEHEIGIKACYDGLDEYIDTLTYAIETAYPGYERIGVKVGGEWRQLNPNILQIENEYYTTVRPKQILQDNEKPTVALKRRGVRYFELRSLDVNAYHPLGVSEEQLRFLEALTCLCLFSGSPRISPWERGEIDKNEMAAAQRGREPGLTLMRNGCPQTLTSWAEEVCAAMEPVCDLLDRGEEGTPYRDALVEQQRAVADPELTPSARMLAEMRERGEGFYQFARRKSKEHQRHFLATRLAEERRRELEALAAKSLEDQRALEASDTLSFDEYLARYFAQRAEDEAAAI